MTPVRLPRAAATVPAPGDRRFDVVGIGMSSVDHLAMIERHPRLDAKQELVAYDMQPGGQVPTALVALQRWGMRTAYIGAFADDAGGLLARRALAAEGVDLSAAVIRPHTRQQVSVILIDQVSGERSVLSERADGLVLAASEIPAETLAASRALLMDAVGLEAAVAAARRARAAGVLVVLDTDTPVPGIGELLALTDVLIVSVGFLERLTGRADLRAALRATAARGPWFVGVTLGPGGAMALVNGRLRFVPSYRVQAVDTTGAGDVFHAGTLYGVLHGWPVDDSLRFAAAAAALKCERVGGRPGIPTVERALRLVHGS
jgi:sulfofructose kinase